MAQSEISDTAAKEDKAAPKPRQPYGLKDAGKRLWQTVCKTFDLRDEPHKIELLAQACRVADVIALLDTDASKNPLTTKGSMGQKTTYPSVAEARFQRALLATLLGKLDLPDASVEALAAKGVTVTVTVVP